MRPARSRPILATGAACLLALTLAGCSTGPSDADRAAWTAWSTAIVGTTPNTAASAPITASAARGVTLEFSPATAFRAVELRCIGAARAEFALIYVAGSSTVGTQQDIVCQNGALRTPIAIPTAMQKLTSFTVSATSSDGEGVWTAQLQR
ncbi:hypothetical protein GCM10023065_08060 [Microbacterium laevaniformans]|uniref:hypothetical protein n=1 Tax=Microbacterium laevaniformans TaxID=36807 RepID=UPI00195DC0D7|nr:hypothetical protein [Microbacterium laevaniformans]MBM7751758.1 hypothetical protein [Microbacterium laevaniformans]GLJ63888.1 hypothetical protein GCM10017578_07760 [Microbacterium laevaniformans]